MVYIQAGKGFSLVEVLVTILILSIGLLGLAKLQFWGVKHTGSAYYRTQATLLANEMVERIRANPKGISGGYATAANSCENANINCSAAPAVDCLSTSCSEAQLALADLYEVACGSGGNGDGNGIDDNLPFGKIGVACDDYSSCGMVEVCWQETEADQGDPAQMNRITMEFSL